MTNNYEILDEEQKVDCRQALMNSLQMMIQAYVITNELDNLPITTVLEAVMMLVAHGLKDLSQEERKKHVSDSIVFLRTITHTDDERKKTWSP